MVGGGAGGERVVAPLPLPPPPEERATTTISTWLINICFTVVTERCFAFCLIFFFRWLEACHPAILKPRATPVAGKWYTAYCKSPCFNEKSHHSTPASFSTSSQVIQNLPSSLSRFLYDLEPSLHVSQSATTEPK